MPNTPVQGLPYPALSDPANGPVAFQNLATALEDYKTIIRCTSATRPAHVAGRICYETDTKQLIISDGTWWTAYATGGWQTWTPVWSGTASPQPAIGNGTLGGRWRRVGRAVEFQFYLQCGSTTSFGVNGSQWQWTLPVPGFVSWDYAAPIGTAICIDSGSRFFHADVLYASGDSSRFHLWSDRGASETTITPTTPYTWASGDRVLAQGMYEINASA